MMGPADLEDLLELIRNGVATARLHPVSFDIHSRLTGHKYELSFHYSYLGLGFECKTSFYGDEPVLQEILKHMRKKENRTDGKPKETEKDFIEELKKI